MSDTCIFIKVCGHITAQFCSDIKKNVFERLDQEPSISNIYIDMKDCSYADSTFLGLIVGFNKKLKNISGNKLIIQNIQGECLELLNSMGISKIVTISSETIEFPENLINIENKNTSAKDMLDAHKDLMDLSIENKKKFELFYNELSKEIDE